MCGQAGERLGSEVTVCIPARVSTAWHAPGRRVRPLGLSGGIATDGPVRAVPPQTRTPGRCLRRRGPPDECGAFAVLCGHARRAKPGCDWAAERIGERRCVAVPTPAPAVLGTSARVGTARRSSTSSPASISLWSSPAVGRRASCIATPGCPAGQGLPPFERSASRTSTRVTGVLCSSPASAGPRSSTS